jgi:hypothetical protein
MMTSFFASMLGRKRGIKAGKSHNIGGLKGGEGLYQVASILVHLRGWRLIDLGFTRQEASYTRKSKVGGG